MNVSLVIFKADGTRRDFPVTKERIVVGRKNNCDLRIPLTSVSRQHCEITVTENQVRLKDLGSSNGTYHNSMRVQEAVLSAGDEIVVGPVVFTVVVDGHPAEIRPVRPILDDGNKQGRSDTPVEAGQPQTLSDEPALDMPHDVEVESFTPTVDLDDPAEALEAMADPEDPDEIDLDELQILPDDEADARNA